MWDNRKANSDRHRNVSFPNYYIDRSLTLFGKNFKKKSKVKASEIVEKFLRSYGMIGGLIKKMLIT